MEGKLQKPVFVKVSALENSRDGYNVYVKVISAQHTKNENNTFDMVKAVVGDETASADAFFKGDNAKLIKKDAVIAIRNGKIRLIKGHISLEVDIFGRVTEQKVDITPSGAKNISEKQITRRPRRNDKEEGERRPRREQGQRRPRREQGERPRREEGDRPRREGNNDRPRREQGERPRREQNDRPRREGNNDRPRREQGDRPRRDYDNDRPPRREYDNDRRRQTDNNRPKVEWTKIGAIEPGDENLNIIAQVLSVTFVKNRARVVIGDETGKVKGFFYENQALKEGSTIVIFKVEATVHNEHIELTLQKGGKVEQSRSKKITKVDETVDISAKAWVESA